ncbi:MAG: CocE/NonD family hydrolase [Candidatus Lokiarchaeota archaeon]|nr:CocE/NonD family hydrolase [Candidatus Lokiarchaeota archaeon]MBD3337463.1 CocE/NonD family hydrolase [Candidatus Lokiarchaeota archaeon]
MQDRINSEVNPFIFENLSRRKTSYKEFEKKSYYLTMRDGVKIAVEVMLPENLSSEDKLPTVLLQTRYWRDFEFRIPFRWFMNHLSWGFRKQLFKTGVKRGFVFVSVDVRGTGASFGARPWPWSALEVKDGKEIIDWIIEQPWSDQKVVTMGVSYLGTAAEYVASLNHPNTKGVLPISSQWDNYLEISCPGGIYNHYFMTDWGELDKGLDQNKSKSFLTLHPPLYFLVKGVKPVESDKDKEMLKKALKDHEQNIYVHETEIDTTYRDSVDAVSVFTKKRKIQKSNIPFYVWGGWLDAAVSDHIIKRFMTYNNPMRAIIGDWDHEITRKTNPYFYKEYDLPNEPEVHQNARLDFFELCINDNFTEKALYYYTMGEEKWKRTDIWPPKGQKLQRWYFSENNELTQKKPQKKWGEDNYEVDFDVTTGNGNRWHVHYDQKLKMPDRSDMDKKLLTYTSAPLDNATEITGYLIIKLYMRSTHEDGAIFTYLEDIDEKGKVIYVTEGELRLIHRKISEEQPPYEMVVPYHSFREKDSKPVVPEELMEVTYGFLPTSVLIRKGHRIRIAIAGADKDTFNRYPAEGIPTYTIERNRDHASYVDIPVIE